MHSLDQAEFFGIKRREVMLPDVNTLEQNISSRGNTANRRLAILNFHTVQREAEKEDVRVTLYNRVTMLDSVRDVMRRLSRGQRKLEVVDRFFIERNIDVDRVIVIGAAPGDHWEDITNAYPYKEFEFYDPRDMSWEQGPNSKFFKSIVEKVNFGFPEYILINDIRRERGSASDEEWEILIGEDVDQAIEFYRQAVREPCLAYSMKFRFPFFSKVDLMIPLGVVYLQAWTKRTSTETRIMAQTRDERYQRLNPKIYWQQLGTWNVLRDEVNGTDRKQEKAMLMDSIIEGDIFDRSTYPEGVGMALWSLSNSINTNLLIKLDLLASRMSHLIILLPNLSIAKMWRPGEFDTWFWRDICVFKIHFERGVKVIKRWLKEERGIMCDIVPITSKLHLFDLEVSYESETIVESIDWPDADIVKVNDILIDRPCIITMNEEQVFIDQCIEVEDIVFREGVSMLPLIDMWMLANYDEYGENRRLKSRTYDTTDPVFSLWQAYIYGDDIIPNQEIQTWFNSQTHWVKTISMSIRLTWDIQDVHIWRRLALSQFNDEAVILESTDVTGFFYERSGRRRVKRMVAVSGHLVNMMLMSHLGVVDIPRYLKTIEGNFIVNLGRSKEKKDLLEELNRFKERRLILEDRNAQIVLWHSYYDYIIAVDTYVLIAKAVGYTVKTELVEYVINYLDGILKRFPNARQDGFEAKRFLQNQ
jgi:hypothetical protein